MQFVSYVTFHDINCGYKYFQLYFSLLFPVSICYERMEIDINITIYARVVVTVFFVIFEHTENICVNIKVVTDYNIFFKHWFTTIKWPLGMMSEIYSILLKCFTASKSFTEDSKSNHTIRYIPRTLWYFHENLYNVFILGIWASMMT